jgi:hypothetical protein
VIGKVVSYIPGAQVCQAVPSTGSWVCRTDPSSVRLRTMQLPRSIRTALLWLVRLLVPVYLRLVFGGLPLVLLLRLLIGAAHTLLDC